MQVFFNVKNLWKKHKNSRCFLVIYRYSATIYKIILWFWAVIYKIFLRAFLVCFSFLIFVPSLYALNPNEDLWKAEFEVDVDIFTPGWKKITGGGNSGNAIEDANFALGYIIEQLMLFIGWFSLLVMTIWAGYIIIHRGDDSSLSKWKEIFIAGALGLTVALLSYYMVSIVRYLIYS